MTPQDQPQRDRRDRLDRFVAAALTGFMAHPITGLAGALIPTRWRRQVCIEEAEAVLAELERREKEQTR